MSVWKRPAVLAVSVVAAAVLTACGDTKSDAGADAPARSSALELLATDLKGSLQKTVEATEKSDSVTLTVQGSVGGEKISMTGAVELRDPIKAELTTTGSENQTVTVRIIDGVIFVEVPADQRDSMDGKSWMKMDPAAGGGQQGLEFSKQLDDVDPTKQVKTLLASEGVTVVGEETVDGTRTVHYTVTTQLADYLEQVDAKLRSAVEGQLTEQGVKEIKIDLWVDEQYRPRRVSVVMGEMSDLTIDYTDYGKPVTVETPPDAETLDLAKMIADMQNPNNN
ncbi:LppX_LprAFG lipoprotein [Micromonospora maris]|uniref:LppX_LprAFG lipoprotein n=1 Tax=Micromonospora maris TaxID=1003110 RepID=UPI0005B9E26F|nr:LppX_LprAFG lipoprotein [Micromonospora maris]